MIGRLLTVALLILLFVCLQSLNAADPSEESLQEGIDRTKTHDGMNLTTGYDSLYMYKGGNVIPGDGISWVRLDPIFYFGQNDIIDVPFWYATAMGNPLPNVAQNYREFDVPVVLTHKAGNFAFTAAYDLYFYFNYPGFRPAGEGIQHELHLGSSWTGKTGTISWTPSLDYFYELGNANESPYGCINPGASFLGTSLTCSIPIIREKLTLDPMGQYNFSFGYSVNQNLNYVWGGNNAQINLPLTWHLTKRVSLTAYAAYSYQWQQLLGTSPGTIWGGGSMMYSF
jgi:hypothetical protein